MNGRLMELSTGADLRQKASSATLPERPPLPLFSSLRSPLPPFPLIPSPLLFPSLRSRPPQIQLEGLGERCKLPQWGLGAEIEFGAF